MKGLVLTGGSRHLYLITKGVSKQLLPIYDGSMVYEPSSVLILAETCHIKTSIQDECDYTICWRIDLCTA